MRRLDDRQKQGYIINEIGDIWVKMVFLSLRQKLIIIYIILYIKIY